MTLDKLQIHTQARIRQVRGGRGVAAHIAQMGIHRGDTLSVVQKSLLSGPIVVEIHGSRVALGRGIAKKVVVEPIS